MMNVHQTNKLNFYFDESHTTQWGAIFHFAGHARLVVFQLNLVYYIDFLATPLPVCTLSGPYAHITVVSTLASISGACTGNNISGAPTSISDTMTEIPASIGTDAATEPMTHNHTNQVSHE